MNTAAIATKSNEYIIYTSVPGTLSIDAFQNAINVFLSFQDVNHRTPDTYKRALLMFRNWIVRTGRHLSELTRADIIQFKQDMRSGENMQNGRPLSPNTINSYLTALRQFYSFCELHGVAQNITKGIKSERTSNAEEHEKSDFTPNQASAILAVADGNKRDAAIMALLMRCGLRTIEVVRANIGDLELIGESYVLTVHGKGDKIRRVPLTPKAWKALNEYLLAERRGARADEPLFASAGHQCIGGRMASGSISRIAKTYIRAVGINDGKHTAHSCRHTALGCIVSEQNHDPNKMQTAQTLAGHSDPATTWIYVKQQAKRDFLSSTPNAIVDTLF